MIRSVAESLRYLSASGLGACSSVRDRILSVAERGFSLLNQYTPDPRLGLLALGWDIATGTPLLADSATLALLQAHAVITGGFAIGQRIERLFLSFQILTKGVNYQDHEGWTRLHYAAALGRIEDARYLVQKGADPNVINRKGVTPLHYAKSGEMVDLLIGGGASVNHQDNDGWTPLLSAAVADLPDVTVALLKNGADPKIKTNLGIFPSDLAKSAKVFQILNGIEMCPEIRGCKTKHEIFDLIFPPFRYGLPENAEALDRSLSYVADLEELRAEGEELFGKYIPSLEELSEDPRVNGDIHAILSLLCEKNPLFKKAWDLANRRDRVTLREGGDLDFVRDGKSVHRKGGGAHYNLKDHSITVDQRGTFKEKCDGLIFETINAIQRGTFEYIDRNAGLGKVGREDYAFLTERVEMNSSQMAQMILSAGIPCERGIDVARKWAGTNITYSGATVSHTDSYRKVWDNSYGTKYLEAQRLNIRELISQSNLKKRKSPTHLDLALEAAVRCEDLELVKKLIDLGADPRRVEWWTRNLDILRVLMGRERESLFRNCKSPNEFFDHCFPWDENLAEKGELVQKIGVHPNILRMGELNRELTAKGVTSFDQKSPNLLTVLRSMAADENGFLFFVPTKEGPNLILSSDGLPLTFYDPKMHRIKVPREGEPTTKYQSMFLGLLLAAQKSSFDQLDQLAGSGELDREEFALLFMKINYDAAVCAGEILSEYGICGTPVSFKEAWIEYARLPHITLLRDYWQLKYAHRYFSRSLKLSK